MIAAALANMTREDALKQNTDGRIRLTGEDEEKKSNGSAAKSLGVGVTSVKDAKEVRRDAPDLAEKVSRGEMSLNAAKTQSRERRGESPKSTSAPVKSTTLSLDEMMKFGGKNFSHQFPSQPAAQIIAVCSSLFTTCCKFGKLLLVHSPTCRMASAFEQG